MKKFLLVPIVLFVFGLCITGCSSDLDDTYSEDVERISEDVDGVNTSVMEKLLCDALTEIIENVNGKYSNGGYILFFRKIMKYWYCQKMSTFLLPELERRSNI